MNDSMKSARQFLSLSGAAIGALLLTSCTVGPQYVKPSVPMTPAFKEPPPEQFQESKDWKPAQPSQPLPVKWWEVFGDPRLQCARRTGGARQTQDLKVAEAHFREARAP